MNELTIEDLVLIYSLVSKEINKINITCIPNTLINYYNQLMKLDPVIHAEILKKNKNDK